MRNRCTHSLVVRANRGGSIVAPAQSGAGSLILVARRKAPPAADWKHRPRGPLSRAGGCRQWAVPKSISNCGRSHNVANARTTLHDAARKIVESRRHMWRSHEHALVDRLILRRIGAREDAA